MVTCDSATECHMVHVSHGHTDESLELEPDQFKESRKWTVKMAVNLKPDLTFIFILKSSSVCVKKTD